MKDAIAEVPEFVCVVQNADGSLFIVQPHHACITDKTQRVITYRAFDLGDSRLSSTPARALSDSEREALERCEHTAWRPQDIYTLATLVRRLAAGGCACHTARICPVHESPTPSASVGGEVAWRFALPEGGWSGWAILDGDVLPKAVQAQGWAVEYAYAKPPALVVDDVVALVEKWRGEARDSEARVNEAGRYVAKPSVHMPRAVARAKAFRECADALTAALAKEAPRG